MKNWLFRNLPSGGRPLWTETPLNRDPPDRDPLDIDLPTETPLVATAAVGTHPNGMYSCFFLCTVSLSPVHI